MKKAFTLIELVMVIAILSILTSIAVNKMGGVKESASRKVSLANMKAVERGVGAFLASGGRLNRLDSLINAESSGVARSAGEGFGSTIYTNFTVGAAGGVYLGPNDPMPVTEAVSAANAGLSPSLVGVLARYSLSAAEVEALRVDFGLRFLEFHNLIANAEDVQANWPSERYGRGDDGSLPRPTNAMDPNLSACIVRAVTNGLYVAAINPATDLGRAIYRSCGAELLATKRRDGSEHYDESKAIAEVKSAGGPLIAFGLGDEASVVGAPNAGLEAAPTAAFAPRQYYSRYILLFRLRPNSAGGVRGEFAGVIDCEGATAATVRDSLR